MLVTVIKYAMWLEHVCGLYVAYGCYAYVRGQATLFKQVIKSLPVA